MAYAGNSGNSRAQGPEKLESSPEVTSPAVERKNLMEELVVEKTKDKRQALSKELVSEVKEEDKSEKERIDLLCSVLDQKSAEEIDRYTAVLKDKPEESNEAKAEALMFFRDTFPYFFAVLALKNKIDPRSEAKTFLSLKDRVSDAQERALLDALSFFEENPSLESTNVFQTKLLPDVKTDTQVLYDAAKEVLEDDNGAGTWMMEKIKEHPVASGALLLAGAFGVYKLGQWLYKKARGEDEAEEVEKKPGLLSELTSGWSFLKKTLVSTALFTGGLLVAGRVMGMDGAESWLKEHNLGWMYKVRFISSISHFSYGRWVEGLATWNFGARSEEERERHKVYAEFFGISDDGIWLTAGLKVKDLLAADASREHPLAAGAFAKIPWIGEYFKLPDQVKMEEAVKGKLESKMDLLRGKIEGADDMTVDELLKKAFELHLFSTQESAGWEGYSDDLQGLVKKEEKESADFSERVDACVEGKDKLEEEDLLALQEAQVEVTNDLDGLRLSRPTYWTDMEAIIEKTLPGLTFDDDELQSQDYLAARASYKAFFEQAQKEDMDAIGVDIEELQKIGEFFKALKPGEPLNVGDKALLKKHTTALKEIHLRVRESLVRAKVTRDKAIKDDAGEHFYDVEKEDLADLGALYLHSYKGVWYGLEWSLNEVIDENTGAKGKALGITGVLVSGVVAGSIGFDVAQGAVAINEGKVMSGLTRAIIFPGRTLPLFAYQHMRANPSRLLEAVIKGKLHPEYAVDYCEKALEKSDVFWKNWRYLGGKDWRQRMKYLENLKEIFDNRENLRWLDELVEGTASFDRSIQWQVELKDMVERTFKMSFDDFITKMRAERGTKKVILDTLERIPGKERVIQFFERMAQKLGRPAIPRPILEKMFERGGAGLKYLGYFARRGMPIGVAYLSTYWVCSETYEAKDKGERVLLTTTALLASEIGWRAVMATRFAPKHPLIMAGVALAASLGVSVAAENFVAPLLKSRDFVPTYIRGVTAPVLYTAGAGQLFDTVGHYYNPTNTTEKDYFTRTTYLPLIGERKMAFHDGAFLAGGDYFEERTPEEAVDHWNSQVQSKISDLKAEEQATKESEEPVDNSAEIEKLEAQIIDRDWNHRQIQKVESLKADIAGRGDDILAKIMGEFGTSVTPNEKALMESILVTDSPESWMDESFMNIEKEPRYATVMKFAEKIGQEDEVLTFLERKRLIQSDISFYQSIGHYDAIMKPDDKEKLVALLGIDPELADKAEQTYEELVKELGLDDLTGMEGLELDETGVSAQAA